MFIVFFIEGFSRSSAIGSERADSSRRVWASMKAIFEERRSSIFRSWLTLVCLSEGGGFS